MRVVRTTYVRLFIGCLVGRMVWSDIYDIDMHV